MPPVEREQVRISLFGICTLFDIDADAWWEIVKQQPEDAAVRKVEPMRLNPVGYTTYFLTDVISAFRHSCTNKVRELVTV